VRLHQDFKFNVIAGLDQHRDWSMTERDVLEWRATKRTIDDD
jgi:hypothetical protein